MIHPLCSWRSLAARTWASPADESAGGGEGCYRHLQAPDHPYPYYWVITRGPLQYVLLDTPGVHKPHNKLGKRMDKTASDSIADVDVSMMLFEPYGALNESEMVLVEALKKGGPAIAVINKTDLSKTRRTSRPARRS